MSSGYEPLAAEDNLKRFQDDLDSICASLQRKIAAINNIANTHAAPETRPTGPGQDSSTPVHVQQIRQLLTEADADVYDGRQALDSMETDIRHLPYNLKTKAVQQVNTCREKFNQHANKIQQIKLALDNPNSSAPLGMGKSDETSWRTQRQKLLGTRHIVDETSASLDRTARAIAESAEAGAATSQQLGEQKETLLHARDNIHDTDDILAKSKRTLMRMKRKLMTNKLMQFGIILLEILILIFVVWIKYYK